MLRLELQIEFTGSIDPGNCIRFMTLSAVGYECESLVEVKTIVWLTLEGLILHEAPSAPHKARSTHRKMGIDIIKEIIGRRKGHRRHGKKKNTEEEHLDSAVRVWRDYKV